MSETAHPNSTFIGQEAPDSGLNTPYLAIDLDALMRNAKTMMAFAKGRGLKLVPHAKTHKSVAIANLQMDLGADGICCAKLGEAEIFCRAGVRDILITSPIVGKLAISRLVALSEQCPRLRIVVDCVDNVRSIGSALEDAGHRIDVLIDVDPGLHRTGVTSPEQALHVAAACSAWRSLNLSGVQFFCGPEQHISDYARRREAFEIKAGLLVSTLSALRKAGYTVTAVSGGGTGSHEIDADLGVLTELQAGSYIVMDDQYKDCVLRADGSCPFEQAMYVCARVISANTEGLVTVDAGLKSFSTEGKSPRPLLDNPWATYIFRGDEHGHVGLSGTGIHLYLGDPVRLSVPHCDPTINLYDQMHAFRGKRLEAIWPVDARGRTY